MQRGCFRASVACDPTLVMQDFSSAPALRSPRFDPAFAAAHTMTTPNPPPSPADDAALKARRLLNAGLVFAAQDEAADALRHYPHHWRLRHIAALAMAEAGARVEALASLETADLALSPKDPGFAEIVSLRARIHKDLWRAHGERHHLSVARELYARAYEATGSSFAGINAAAMAYAEADAANAAAIARDVMARVAFEDTSDDDESRYWRAATLGEASLIAGEPEAIIAGHYETARRLAGAQYRLMLSSRRQLLMLQDAGLQLPPQLLQILKAPKVAAFLPAPGMGEDEAKRFIAAMLGEHAPELSFSSAARGADLSFIEAMLARKGEVNIVLPFAKHDFIRARIGSDAAAQAQFESALAHAAQVTYATAEPWLEDETLFHFAADMVRGLAAAHAAQLGGTFVLIGKDGAPAANASASGTGALAAGKREIRALLFADIVGYSRMGEEHMRAFSHFLAMVKDALGSAHRQHGFDEPEYVNTWGDAVFAVMGDVSAMTRYAFALRHAIGAASARLEASAGPLDVRIALHCGPVFRLNDALTARENFYGSHVNRAARLEPLARPGQILASEQFIALLENHATRLLPRDAWRATYAGLLELPKGFGRQRVYLLDETKGSA